MKRLFAALGGLLALASLFVDAGAPAEAARFRIVRRPPVTWLAAWNGARGNNLGALQAWYAANTGPRCTGGPTVSGSPSAYVVSSQAIADALKCGRVDGRVSIPTNGIILEDVTVVGVPRDPDVYDYAIDGSGNPLDATATAKRDAGAALGGQLIYVSGNNVTVRYSLLDGSNERMYAGFGGLSYATGFYAHHNEITAFGDDAFKLSIGGHYEYNYVHDMTPWVNASYGTYYSGPNNYRYPHQDAFQGIRGNFYLFRNMLLMPTGNSTTSVIIIKNDTGQATDEGQIEENYLEGSNNRPITLSTQNTDGTGAGISNVYVKDNVWSKNYPSYPGSGPVSLGTICASWNNSFLGSNAYREDASAVSFAAWKAC